MQFLGHGLGPLGLGVHPKTSPLGPHSLGLHSSSHVTRAWQGLKHGAPVRSCFCLLGRLRPSSSLSLPLEHSSGVISRDVSEPLFHVAWGACAWPSRSAAACPPPRGARGKCGTPSTQLWLPLFLSTLTLLDQGSQKGSTPTSHSPFPQLCPGSARNSVCTLSSSEAPGFVHSQRASGAPAPWGRAAGYQRGPALGGGLGRASGSPGDECQNGMAPVCFLDPRPVEQVLSESRPQNGPAQGPWGSS